MKNRNTLVYDLPTRLFHWLFAAFFLTSFVIAKTVDDESIVFSYHMISGILLSGLVIWRVFWGIFGSRYSRFSNFSLNPNELKNYFIGIAKGTKKIWAGHNPASSWAAITMFTLTLGLGFSGYLMTTGNKEAFEDIHELFANAFILLIILHIAGIILHTIRHQDSIGLSMLDGKKEGIAADDSNTSTKWFSAGILLTFVILSLLYLTKSFDAQNKNLKLFGQVLQLGEGENEKEQMNKNEETDHHENNGDDD